MDRSPRAFSAGGDLVDAGDECSLPKRDLLLLRKRPDAVESIGELVRQTRANLVPQSRRAAEGPGTHSKYETVDAASIRQQRRAGPGCRVQRGSRLPRSSSVRCHPPRRASYRDGGRSPRSAVLRVQRARGCRKGARAARDSVTCWTSGKPSSESMRWRSRRGQRPGRAPTASRRHRRMSDTPSSGRALRDELLSGDPAGRSRSPARRSVAPRGSTRVGGRHVRSPSRRPPPVASCRKSEPPRAIGLPVTISGTA